MRIHRSVLVGVAAATVALSACTVGQRAERSATAQKPAGVNLVLGLRESQVKGELLEVRDSSLVVRTAQLVVRVPFSSVRYLTIPDEKRNYRGALTNPEIIERLRLTSRFPAGLPPDQLERLLRAHNQQTIRVYERLDPADSVAEAAFIGAARAGTLRYHDVEVARADGYRLIGGELPSLGEHWVNNRRALADSLDPAAPSILVYARIQGKPMLAGVAYTRLLAPSAIPPDFPRSHPDAWHEHNGGVEDEVLPLAHQSSHHASHTPPNGSPRLRIAVMHAWIGIANPDGVWESENWALPYARLGLEPRADAEALEARGLSLATSADYYLRAIASTGELDARETKRVEGILREHSSRALIMARANGVGRDEALSALWSAVWDEIATAISPDAAAKVVALRTVLSADSSR